MDSSRELAGQCWSRAEAPPALASLDPLKPWDPPLGDHLLGRASPGSWGPRAWGSGREGRPWAGKSWRGPGCSGPCAALRRWGQTRRCSSCRCGGARPLHPVLRASWADGRSAWRGFWVSPASQPRKAPPAPFPCAPSAQRPRGSSRSHVAARCPWGTLRAQDASVSVGAGLAAHQATPVASPLAPLLECLRWETRVGRKFPAPGASLRGRGSGRHWRRQDLSCP